VAGIINDRETIEFVREQAGAAKYVTSVCTGAPPFDSGHPDKAPTLKSELLSARYDGFISTYRKRIEQAAPF
jgi:hypothetical protein